MCLDVCPRAGDHLLDPNRSEEGPLLPAPRANLTPFILFSGGGGTASAIVNRTYLKTFPISDLESNPMYFPLSPSTQVLFESSDRKSVLAPALSRHSNNAQEGLCVWEAGRVK